jgi:hypothetical protein
MAVGSTLRWCLVILIACGWTVTGLTAAGVAQAPQVRYYEQNGVTYRETREQVQRPVTQMKTTQEERTIYEPQVVTQMNEQQYTYYEPVTTYRWQAQLQGRFNPFVQPYYAWRLVPTTQWQARTGKVRCPVTEQKWVASTQQVEVRRRELGFKQEEQVSRVAVMSRPITPGIGPAPTAVAERSTFVPSPRPGVAGGSVLAGRTTLPNNLRSPQNLPVAPQAGRATIAGGIADAGENRLTPPSLGPRTGSSGTAALGAMPVAPARVAANPGSGLAPVPPGSLPLGGIERLDRPEPTRSRAPLSPTVLR